MFLVKASTNAFSPCEGASVCQHPTVKCFANASHVFWFRKVAYSYFPQIIVHVLAKTIEKGLSQVPQLGSAAKRSRTITRCSTRGRNGHPLCQ